MRWAALILLVRAVGLAQVMVGPDAADLARASGELRCEIQPIAPKLNFSFRFQAGYVVRVPLAQFHGAGHGYRMLLRIEPQGAKPVYLAGSFPLPEVPKTDMEGESAGSFLLGEGRYAATLAVRDDQGRECRREWTIRAALKAGERAAKVPMRPGSVAELSEPGAFEPEGRTGSGLRLTVLLHAAPVRPRAAKVPPEDVELLLGALSSLMHQAEVSTVRLVVFNLDQRRQIYREDRFALRHLERVSQAIYGMQLALVDYKALQGQSESDLLASLVNRELQAKDASDAVVFLGPRGRPGGILPKDALAPHTRGMPQFFYVEYQAEPPLAMRRQGPPGAPIDSPNDVRGFPGMGSRPERTGPPIGMIPAPVGRPDLLEQTVQRLNLETATRLSLK